MPTDYYIHNYTRVWKSEWWEMKAGEVRRIADRNNMKGRWLQILHIVSAFIDADALENTY